MINISIRLTTIHPSHVHPKIVHLKFSSRQKKTKIAKRKTNESVPPFFSRISASTGSMEQHCPFSRRTTWPAQWEWSWAQLWSFAPSSPGNWARARSVCTALIATRRPCQPWTRPRQPLPRRNNNTSSNRSSNSCLEGGQAARGTDKQWRRLLWARRALWRPPRTRTGP